MDRDSFEPSSAALVPSARPLGADRLLRMEQADVPLLENETMAGSVSGKSTALRYPYLLFGSVCLALLSPVFLVYLLFCNLGFRSQQDRTAPKSTRRK